MMVKKHVAAMSMCLSFFAATVALAEGELTRANVTTFAKSADLGLEYRASLVYDDQKMSKVDGDPTDPTKTSVIIPNLGKLFIKGELTGDTSYKISYDLINKATNYFVFTWQPTEMIGIQLGQDKIKQGGYESISPSYSTLINSHYYTYAMPFEKYAPIIGAYLKTVGKVSLQLTNDGTAANKRNYANNTQPATILEYSGDFNGVKPLVQVGIYDLARSKYFDLGIMYAQAGITASLDYIMDQRAAKVGNSAKINNLSNIVLNASYKMGKIEPFFKYTMFDVKQHTTDLKGNDYSVTPATATSSATITNNFTDNGTNLALGSFFLTQGEFFKPFAAINMESAKFYKTASAFTGDTETRTDTRIIVGAAGTF